MRNLLQGEIEESTPILINKIESHFVPSKKVSFGSVCVIISNPNDEDNILIKGIEPFDLTEYSETIEKPFLEYINNLDDFLSPSKTIRREELVEEIVSLKSLKNNWDGYGSIPLETKSATNALSIIYWLEDENLMKIGDVYSNPNGTISFEWENDSGNEINLEVGQYTFSYYVKLNSNHEPSFHDKNGIDQSSIRKLANFIQSL